jgi:hypothetical protein
MPWTTRLTFLFLSRPPFYRLTMRITGRYGSESMRWILLCLPLARLSCSFVDESMLLAAVRCILLHRTIAVRPDQPTRGRHKTRDAASLASFKALGSSAAQAWRTVMTLDLLATTPTKGTNIHTYHTKGINMHTYHIRTPQRALRSGFILDGLLQLQLARLKRFVQTRELWKNLSFPIPNMAQWCAMM